MRRALTVVPVVASVALAVGCGGDAAPRADGPEGQRSRVVAAAAGLDGGVLAAWAQRHPDGGHSLMIAARSPEGRWTRPQTVAPRRVWEIGRIRVALGPQGEALVSYVLLDGRRAAVQGVWRGATGDWEEPATLSRVGSGFDPVPAIAGDWTAAVAFAEVAPAEGAPQVAVRPAGRRWRDPVPLGPRGPGYLPTPAVAGAAERVCVLWSRVTDRSPRTARPTLRLHCVGADGVPRDERLPAVRATGGALAAHGGGLVVAWSAPAASGTGHEVGVVTGRAGRWVGPHAVDAGARPFGAPVVAGGTVAWTAWATTADRVVVSALDPARVKDDPVPVGEFSAAPHDVPPGGPPIPPPGEIVVAQDGSAILWSEGGFPYSELVRTAAMAVRDASGAWRRADPDVDGTPLRPLAVSASVAVWSRHTEPTGAGSVEVAAGTVEP